MKILKDPFWRHIATIIMVVLVSSVLLVGIYITAEPQDAVTAAEVMGFTQVEIVEQLFIPGLGGCDANDSIGWRVVAINPRGDAVALTICSGVIFKDTTVRTSGFSP